MSIYFGLQVHRPVTTDALESLHDVHSVSRAPVHPDHSGEHCDQVVPFKMKLDAQLVQSESPGPYQSVHAELQAVQDTPSPESESYHPNCQRHSPVLSLVA